MNARHLLLCTVALAFAAAAPAAASESGGELEMLREMQALAFEHMEKVMVEARGMHRMAKCDEEDKECVLGCTGPLEPFTGESCLGLAPGQPVFDQEDGEPNVDFDKVFPDLGSNNLTNAQLDSFCPCTSVTVRMMRAFFKVGKCVQGSDFGTSQPGGTDSDGEVSPTPDQILDLIGTFVGFLCIKNGDDYCSVLDHQLDIEELGSGSDASDSSDSSVSQDICDDLTAFGCCSASFVELFQSDAFKAITGEALADGVAEINTFLDACGLGEVEPCLKPGQSATFTKATITLQANFSELASPELLHDFKVAFAKDVAKSLDLSPLQVEILSVTEGSVVVNFRVRGDVTTKLNTALTSGIPLNNTRTAVPAYSAVDDADSDDASGVQTEEVTNDTDTAPAPAFGPASSLVLLLAAALAAFFL